MKTQRLDLGDLQILCDEAGQSERALLLLHGLTGHRRDFEIVLSDLAKSGRTLAPDLRGHGGSSRDGTTDHVRLPWVATRINRESFH